MKQSQAGRPRKDPSTGYMLSHSLSTTDVTKAQVPGNVHRYWHLLVIQRADIVCMQVFDSNQYDKIKSCRIDAIRYFVKITPCNLYAGVNVGKSSNLFV